MTNSTEEWQLKPDNTSIKYFFRIKDFGLKRRSSGIGQEIASRPFKIGSTTFQIKAYPAGKSDGAKNNVSVFIFNKSKWRAEAQVSISVKGTVKISSRIGFDGDGYSGWGLEKFANHGVCHVHNGKHGILDTDESLMLEAEVRLLKEEVTSEIDLSGQDELTKLKEELKEMKRENEELKLAKNRLETAIMSAMEKLTISVNQPAVQPMVISKKSADLQCPICMMDAKPPMRLKQCINGHLICDSCFNKTQDNSTGGKNARP